MSRRQIVLLLVSFGLGYSSIAYMVQRLRANSGELTLVEILIVGIALVSLVVYTVQVTHFFLWIYRSVRRLAQRMLS